MAHKGVYLDHAATTPCDGEILDEMLVYMREEFGNASSLHSYGREAAYALACARDLIKQTLGEDAEVYFTSGGTEADNWAVRCLAQGKDVVVSDIEHQAVLSAASLRGNSSYAHVNTCGTVCALAVERALTANTGLVCVMAVNNETGCIQPLDEISALCKRRNALLFSDCVQASTLDLKSVFALCDGIALSSHKIYGPKGVGALVLKKGVKISPLIVGGEQEKSLRGGTQNVGGIVAFSRALQRVQQSRKEIAEHVNSLRELFESRVCAALGDRVTVDGVNRSAGISHMTFYEGGDALLARLDMAGVACSGGAACSAHATLPSHVMLAMGKSEQEAKHGIRFSFGKDTTREQTLFAADTLISLLK